MFNALTHFYISYIKKKILKENSLLVFKNFPNNFILEIANTFKFLTDPSILFKDEMINLQSILKNKKAIIQNLFSLESHQPQILLYEELLLSIQNLHDIDLIEADIFIFTNSSYSSIPNQSTILFSDLDHEIDEGKTEFDNDSIFSVFYANSYIQDKWNLIQSKNIETKGNKRIKVIDYADVFDMEKIKIINNSAIKEKSDLLFNIYSMSEPEYIQFKSDLFIGTLDIKKIHSVSFMIDLYVQKNSETMNEIQFINFLLTQNKIFVQNIGLTKKVSKSSRADFVEILKKYWKSDNFRNLEFYENPDMNKEINILRQDFIIDEIIDQVENVKNGKNHNDIFMTAPTGAGKSVLFQIPGIYLHEKSKFLTIVVSPLIALMFDQIAALKEKGITIAEVINSNVNYMKRNQIIKDVIDGKVSILYLSPELLLSYSDLKYFIGERELGLLVIDEAHLVTTWGRDFRIDYWYLGNYIRKLRNFFHQKFVVLALTATAVYGGKDDVVYETISSLNLKNPKFYIGNIKRKNIDFKINPLKITGSHETGKIQQTALRIKEYVINNQKAIAYFPWKRQIYETSNEIVPIIRKKTDVFLADLQSEQKKMIIEGFQKGDIRVVLATKAFGMGIDVPDINCIYHHAPSGSLSDYVQEIGRCARDEGIIGKAEIDFNTKDLKFSNILLGLSRLKQYQLKLVIQKLYQIFVNQNSKQNFLTTPEDFGFIFDRDHLDNNIKSALMLIEKDLLAKYGYNVLIVRPRNLFSQVFCCIKKSHENDFFEKYEGHYKLLKTINDNSRTDKDLASIEDCGDIYQLELAKIWEKNFAEYTFPELKKLFFNGALFLDEKKENYVFPRLMLKITLNANKEKSLKRLQCIFSLLYQVLTDFHEHYFNLDELIKSLKKEKISELESRKISNAIVSMFTYGFDPKISALDLSNDIAFLHKRSADFSGEEYRFSDEMKFIKLRNNSYKYFNILFPDSDAVFKKYIPIGNISKEFRVQLAYLLEAFDIGYFEIIGGEYPQIFVRFNDPNRIKQLAQGAKYSNVLLDGVKKRHERASEKLIHFFTTTMNNKERWLYIEDYFLGK